MQLFMYICIDICVGEGKHLKMIFGMMLGLEFYHFGEYTQEFGMVSQFPVFILSIRTDRSEQTV